MKLHGIGRKVTSAGLMREESYYLLLASSEKWIGYRGTIGPNRPGRLLLPALWVDEKSWTPGFPK